MLPKERVIAALEFGTPDRIPVGETGIDYPITEQALGHPTLYRGKWKEHQALWQGRRDEYVESCKRDVVALAHKFEHDFVPVFLVPSRWKEVPQPEFITEYKWRLADGRVYQYSPETEGHAFLVDSPPLALDELLDLPTEIDESELDLIHHVVKEMGDTHFILGRAGSALFPLERYRMDDMLTSMIDQPDVVHRIIEIETEYVLRVGERMLEAGCDAIIDLADVAGSDGPYMSPKMFREFMFPHLRALCDLAHARGGYFIKHADGNVWSLLDMMVEAGVDGWHGIQPSIGMTLPRLQSKYGGRICFFGGLDLDTLVRAPKEEIVRQVHEAVESAPRTGGLVVTSSNTLMVGVPYDNYLTVLDTLAAYRA